jgi:aminotransferase
MVKEQPFMTRLRDIQESVISEVTRVGDEAGAINLSQGMPGFDSPSRLLQVAVRAIQGGDNQYSFPFGLLPLRQAVAARYARYNHISAAPETGVRITCGSSEATIVTFLALTEPGDEVIISEPWCESHLPACHLAGAQPRFVPLREPDYTLDPAELRAAFNARTRLILVNTPHNPTGSVIGRSELATILSAWTGQGATRVRISFDKCEQTLHEAARGLRRLTKERFLRPSSTAHRFPVWPAQ